MISIPSFRGIQSDGEVYTTWICGHGNTGSLGLGDTADRLSLTQVGDRKEWVQVDGIAAFATGFIKNNGTLWTTGSNGSGNLGHGDTLNRSSPTQVGSLQDWKFITGNKSANGDGAGGFSIAIKKDGTLWAWGVNSNAQLGLGDTFDRSSPVQVGSLTNWKTVSCHAIGGIAIKTDGTLWGWGGQGNIGIYGNGSTAINIQSSPVQIGSSAGWVHVSCNRNGWHAIYENGEMWCCGANGGFEMAVTYTSIIATPIRTGTGGVGTWKDVAGGARNFMAIRSDGTLWGWSANNFGKLGLGDTITRSSHVQVGSLTDWMSLSSGSAQQQLPTILAEGGDFNAALKTDYTLWSWGRNLRGQLGSGNTVDRSSPAQVPGVWKKWSKHARGIIAHK